MKKFLSTSALSVAVLIGLTACGDSPKDRMVAICEKEQNEKSKQSCVCTAEKLEGQIEKDKYEILVTKLEEAEAKEENVKPQEMMGEGGVDQATMMAFAKAAKECTPLE